MCGSMHVRRQRKSRMADRAIVTALILLFLGIVTLAVYARFIGPLPPVIEQIGLVAVYAICLLLGAAWLMILIEKRR